MTPNKTGHTSNECPQRPLLLPVLPARPVVSVARRSKLGQYYPQLVTGNGPAGEDCRGGVVHQDQSEAFRKRRTWVRRHPWDCFSPPLRHPPGHVLVSDADAILSPLPDVRPAVPGRSRPPGPRRPHQRLLPSRRLTDPGSATLHLKQLLRAWRGLLPRTMAALADARAIRDSTSNHTGVQVRM